MGGANYELSRQFFSSTYYFGLRVSLLRFCASVLLVLLRAVLDSYKVRW